jgi:hypothetical protein
MDAMFIILFLFDFFAFFFFAMNGSIKVCNQKLLDIKGSKRINSSHRRGEETVTAVVCLTASGRRCWILPVVLCKAK